MTFRSFKCLLYGCLTLGALISLNSADELREGFFNSSAYLRLNTPVSLYGHIGLSFKSCSGGELFSQHANGHSIKLMVGAEGLLFQSIVFGRHSEVRLAARLLDNAWHAVNIIYRLGDLTLYAGGHQQVLANKTLNPEILAPELSGKGSILSVGSGFHGCILEGPSLVLEASNLLQSVNVVWGPCPLKSPGCSKLDMCFYDPCLNHGTCVSYSDRYECQCTPRYTGTNCERDNGSVCDRKPCKNNGQCKEDTSGNFHCICDAAHTGTLCETPTNAQNCEQNPCHNNATCRVSPLSPDRPECACLPGFRGPMCEVNINECQSNPCRNGGTCYDGDNSYTCHCGRSGYKGEHCDVNVNECEPISPCLNQGTCFDIYGGYTCQCPSGFAGQNCELNLNECSSNPCFNGGTCEDQVGSYLCRCRPGFSGPNCELMGVPNMAGMTVPTGCAALPPPCPPELDCVSTSSGSISCVCKHGYQGIPPNCTEIKAWAPCVTNTCLHGGTCLVSGEMTICNCLPGYTGKTCSHLLNECLSNPCQYGGTCVPHGTGFICKCPDHRLGERCERALDMSPCASSPCLNIGSCVATSATEFRCDCPPGFTGVLCEEAAVCTEGGECPEKQNKSLVDGCAKTPCNNGTCVPLEGGSYECKCPLEFNGKHCDIDINECDDYPKICNNGICFNTHGGYQCFCTPGYAGNQCDIDIDECLSHPCKNNATCENKVNNFYCKCLPGYAGRDCGIDIDECQSNPCLNGGTCQDHVAGFTCVCPVGLTGVLCETNIDDCDPQPCQHEGRCIDGINNYQCDCTDTGFEGLLCENNIDDCLSNPCTNEAKCVDLIKNFRCECYPGYIGLNCEIDINECEKNPCMNGGTCFEHSRREFYSPNNNVSVIPKFFLAEFDINKASGYECVCVPGIVGMKCEKDLDECESSPCIHGSCNDKVGGYDCECQGGFEGLHCENEINECDRYKPCVKGTCEDRRNDYYCLCQSGFGGKNCSVPLEGCKENKCQNNGRCIPYLENETDHKFNCSCASGFRGKICDKVTTISLRGTSHVLIRKGREEGYDISFKMKTTLPSGLLAIGEGLTYYMLELTNGRLNLRSSLLNRIEGVSAGSALNDSRWQRVFVAINSSHLVLGANDEQTIYPITLTEANTSHTSFMTTYLGGTVSSLVRLANSPAFTGCMEDVVINGEWIIPQDASLLNITLVDIEEKCVREEQCNPNLCRSGGQCTDLWRTFSCTCVRPFLGHTCQYNYTAATFGHENASSGSLVSVQVNEAAMASLRYIVDISMFIRTRQERGFIFYLGSQPGTLRYAKETFIVAELEGGELRVRIQFGGNPEGYSVGGTRLDNGYSHLIQVVRNGTLVAVRINGTENFRKTISAQEPLIANVLYLGGLPQTAPLPQQHQGETTIDPISRRVSRQIEAPSTRSDAVVHFKGVIQDVRVTNGSRTMVVEFFPLEAQDLSVHLPFGNVSFDPSKVLPGEVSDDTCRSDPCQHEGVCTVTWNDFTCDCPHGYKGKFCQEMEFCQLQDCPTGSECRNLEDGYECVANVTLRGFGNDLLRYSLVAESEDLPLDNVLVSYRSHVGGTILHIADKDLFFSVSAFLNETTVTWRLDSNSTGQQQRFSRQNADEDWVTIALEVRGSTLTGGFADATDPKFTVSNFSIDAWRRLVRKGKIIVGGLDAEHEKPVTVSPRLVYTIDSMLEGSDSATHGNAIDFPVTSADSAGRYFKGCLGEIRIGSMLLPFFTPDLLYNDNFTASSYFALKVIPPPLLKTTGCVLCFDEECQNGGSCEDPSGTHRCTCAVGFERDDCSKDIDWCRGPPQCENNATCVDGISNFTCACLPGFAGPLCAIDIDECASNPCIHGKCEDLIAGYKCQCDESYVGRNCESFKIITCADAPCKNGSTCIDGFNSTTNDNFTCSCAEGLVGRLCDEAFCWRTPCLHQGVCHYSDATPRCVCAPGYDGLHCERDINDCEASPCLHGGKCQDLVNDYICDCLGTGYEGRVCDQDVDECATQTALCNNGVCNNTEGSYKCMCDPLGENLMCGYYCNITDPCSLGNPCQNNGICMEKCTFLSDYQCECPQGYLGKNCTEELASQGPSAADVALIVGPIAAFLLLAAAVGLTVFIMMARKKRATRGTYSPSQQEYCNPRVEMDNVLKPPPEERLI